MDVLFTMQCGDQTLVQSFRWKFTGEYNLGDTHILFCSYRSTESLN